MASNKSPEGSDLLGLKCPNEAVLDRLVGKCNEGDVIIGGSHVKGLIDSGSMVTSIICRFMEDDGTTTAITEFEGFRVGNKCSGRLKVTIPRLHRNRHTKYHF